MCNVLGFEETAKHTSAQHLMKDRDDKQDFYFFEEEGNQLPRGQTYSNEKCCRWGLPHGAIQQWDMMTLDLMRGAAGATLREIVLLLVVSRGIKIIKTPN